MYFRLCSKANKNVGFIITLSNFEYALAYRKEVVIQRVICGQLYLVSIISVCLCPINVYQGVTCMRPPAVFTGYGREVNHIPHRVQSSQNRCLRAHNKTKIHMNILPWKRRKISCNLASQSSFLTVKMFCVMKYGKCSCDLKQQQQHNHHLWGQL